MATSMGESDDIAFTKPVECGNVANFLSLIKGWFSYSCLLLRLVFPEDWPERVQEIDGLLKNLPGEFQSIHDIFLEFVRRVDLDYSLHQQTLDLWLQLCDQIRENKCIHPMGKFTGWCPDIFTGKTAVVEC
jgi:hypothetical protein